MRDRNPHHCRCYKCRLYHSMKYARKWAWENTWLAWTVFALVVLPAAAAVVTIPNLLMVYRSVTQEIILEVCGFGAGWGVAQVLFGLAVDMIGITLTFSIVLGTSAALGCLIPMVTLHRESLNSTAGYAVLGSIALVLSGVTLCAIAGRLRDRPSGKSVSSQERTSRGASACYSVRPLRVAHEFRCRIRDTVG